MSRTHTLLACALSALWLGLGGGVVADDQPAGAAPSFRAEVEVVTVDAVVAGKDGAPVVGLRKEDFLLTEDGRPQTLTSFEAVELPAAPTAAPPRPPAVSSNSTAETRTARSFALLFDDIHLQPAQTVRARSVIADFLKRSVRESDRVLLAATSGAAWWSARMESGRADLLALLETLKGQRALEGSSREQMSDYEALRIAQRQDRDICERVRRRFLNDGVMMEGNPDLRRMQFLTSCDPLVDARAREVYYREADRIRATLLALERIMDGMAVARGRKTVILVSTGFVFDQELAEAARVVAASRRANAAVYFVDVRGLGVGNEQLFQPHYENPDTYGTTEVVQSPTGSRLTEDSQEAEGAAGVAADTGGFSVRNRNDLAAGMGQIADESRVYYLLGYTPKDGARDGKFRKVEVQVSRKDVKVRARRGYYATAEGHAPPAPGEMPADMRRAADAPFEVDGIGLRASAYVFEQTKPGQARVELVADVDLRKLTFEQIDDRHVGAIDALLGVVRREGGKPVRISETINLRLRPETRENNRSYRYRKALDLEPGHYQGRLVVRDHQGGRVGSVVHDFEVPRLDEWRVASAVLTDVAPVNPQTGLPQPVLVARRDFTNVGTLICSVEVYGAALDKDSGAARVLQGYTLLRGADEVKRSEPKPMEPGAEGKLTRIFGWSLNSLVPGAYELVLLFVDQATGQRKEVRESFTVLAVPPDEATR